MVIYKKTGIDTSVKKVEKPVITPVSLNRIENSAFAHDFLNEESPRLKPKFIDFNKAIQTISLENGLELDYIKNTTNETFSLYYILEIGRNIDKMLPLAIGYLPFLGTDQIFSRATRTRVL